MRVGSTCCLLALVLVAGSACRAQPSGADADYQPFDGGGTDAAALDCMPDLNGKIEADEFSPALGVPVNYLVSPPGKTREIDLEGGTQGDERVWDWSEEYEDDRSLEIAAEPVGDKWYAEHFPNGEFVLPVDLGGDSEGIYRTTDSQMQLLGLASAEEDPKTLLPYEDPVVVYRFPVEVGQEWVSVGRVEDGTFQNAPYTGRDTYRIEVSARGTMKLPEVTFDQVHRVDVELVQEPAAGQTTSRRQVSFLAECYGEVARARSQDGVTKRNFETAAEVRRLGLPR